MQSFKEFINESNMTLKSVTVDDLNAFLKELQKHVEKSYLAFGKDSEYAKNNVPVISYEIGQKYARLVKDSPRGNDRSAFGFIDMENGNMLKSAGWKTPAKNFARGNIFSDNKFARVTWTGIQ